MKRVYEKLLMAGTPMLFLAALGVTGVASEPRYDEQVADAAELVSGAPVAIRARASLSFPRAMNWWSLMLYQDRDRFVIAIGRC